MGQDSQAIYFNSKQLYGFPLKTYVLSYFSLPHFYAPLGGFFWDAPHFHCYGFLDVLYAFKTGSFSDHLELGENKEVM